MNEFIERWLFDPVVGKIIAAILLFLVIHIIVSILNKSAANHIRNSDTRYKVRKSITFIKYTLFFIALTVIFSDKLGSMTVALGVAGAGIAFALQEVIGSIAGWAAISFGNFYRVGDRVQLGGIMGDVIDIGILRTTIMECGHWVKSDQYNGRIVRIANSFVFKEPVFNYSGDFPFLWDEISIPVKYGSDHVLAKEILNKIVNETVGEYIGGAKKTWVTLVDKYRIEDAKIEPMIFLALNDNWMEFSVRYVVDYKSRRIIKDLLFNLILEEFNKTNGKVTIASTTIHIVETPVMNLKIRKEAEN